MRRLSGRVAIVTGGGSGIGRASVQALAAAGARVVVADLDAGSARETVARVAEDGGEAIAQATDVASEASVRAMVASAVEHFGGLDILHNNAACSDPAIMSRDGELAALDTEVWTRRWPSTCAARCSDASTRSRTCSRAVAA